MKFKKLAVIAGVSLVAAIAALAIAVHLYDARSLALSLAASVKADTGRELQFGDVKINVLPRPAVVLSDVRFGNAAWGSQPWLARAGRVHATVDALELLAGRLRIRHIEMSDAVVLLETNREGIGNWVTGSADANSLAWLKTIEIGAFSLEKLALTYRDGTTGSAMSAQLDSARLVAGSATAPIRLDVRATVNGKKVEVVGTLGALGALIANGPGYTVEVDGVSGSVRYQSAERAERAANFHFFAIDGCAHVQADRRRRRACGQLGGIELHRHRRAGRAVAISQREFFQR